MLAAVVIGVALILTVDQLYGHSTLAFAAAILVLLIANAINSDNTDHRIDEAWADSVRRLDAMEDDLRRAAPTCAFGR